MKLTCSRQDEVLNKKAIGFYHIAGGEGAEVKSIIYGIEEEVEVVLFGRQAYRQIIEYDEEGRAYFKIDKLVIYMDEVERSI